MECREEKQLTDYLDSSSKNMYPELKMDLTRCELHILRELGFVCHVELPHKLRLTYIAVLGTPAGLLPEAWKLANDSLSSTLCVRLKPEVVACGVLYAAARRIHVPLPENPPWWEVFDADKRGIEEEVPSPMVVVTNTTKVSSPASKDPSLIIKAAFAKLLTKDSSTNDTRRSIQDNAVFKAKALLEGKQHKTTSDQSRETSKEKERHTSRGRRSGRDYFEKEQENKRHTSRDRRRGRDYYKWEREHEKERHTGPDHRRARDYYESKREHDDSDWDREKVKVGSHRCMIGSQYDAGRHVVKRRRYSSRGRDYDGSC
ncbi:hypothetical protein L2E82_10975 [Cichorium intybus]|uniref:Uncharacterized protein n=1 Tax=Cichorium intybus TaxID=13427 RepID=A0ACB9GC08_CICIN|nr:hypothetical protein L2E82_10975 [Cichorium intybus]